MAKTNIFFTLADRHPITAKNCFQVPFANKQKIESVEIRLKQADKYLIDQYLIGPWYAVLWIGLDQKRPLQVENGRRDPMLCPTSTHPPPLFFMFKNNVGVFLVSEAYFSLGQFKLAIQGLKISTPLLFFLIREVRRV